MPLFVRICIAFHLVVAFVDAVTVTQLCKGQRFGYKIQDPEDCHSFYVCLGNWGAYNLGCDSHYRFDETQQKCIRGKCPPCPCLQNSMDNRNETAEHNVAAAPMTLLLNISDNAQQALATLIKNTESAGNNTLNPTSNGTKTVLTNGLILIEAAQVNAKNIFLVYTPLTDIKELNNSLEVLAFRVTNFETLNISTVSELSNEILNKSNEIPEITLQIINNPENVTASETIQNSSSFLLIREALSPSESTSKLLTTEITDETTRSVQAGVAEETNEFPFLKTYVGSISEVTAEQTTQLLTEDSTRPATVINPTTTTLFLENKETTVDSASLLQGETTADMQTDSPLQMTNPTAEAGTTFNTETPPEEMTTETTTQLQIETLTEAFTTSSTSIWMLSTTEMQFTTPKTESETFESYVSTTTETFTESTVEIWTESTTELQKETTVLNLNTIEPSRQTTEIPMETTIKTTTSMLTESPIGTEAIVGTPSTITPTVMTELSTEDTTFPVTQTSTESMPETIRTSQVAMTSQATEISSPATTEVTTVATPFQSTADMEVTEETTLLTTIRSTATTTLCRTNSMPTTKASTTTSTTCTTATPLTAVATEPTATECNIQQATPPPNSKENNHYHDYDVHSICDGIHQGGIYFIRHPKQCKKYFACYKKQAYAQVCPGDLYFDDKLKMCNNPHLVDCKMGNEKPHHLKATDCKILKSGTFVRDSKNCNKYYVCLNGHAVALYCPREQYFDIENYVCNFKNLVKNCEIR